MFTFCHFEVERIVAQESELSLFTISFVSNEHNLWICWVWIIFKNRKFDTVAQSYEKDFLISNCIEFLMCIFHFFPNSIIEGRLITIIYLYKCKLCFLDVRLGFTTAKQHFSWPSPNIVFIPHYMVIPLTLIIKCHQDGHGDLVSSRSSSESVTL